MRIVVLRSTPVAPDPRVEKEADTLLECGHTVNVIGWERIPGDNPASESITLDHGSIGIHRIQIPCSYGGGIKNILKFGYWNFLLLVELIKRRKSYDAIHACDFDTVMPALFMKIMWGKYVVYDIFDFYVDTFNIPDAIKNTILRLDLWAIHKADAVILAGEDRRAQIGEGDPRHLEFILNTPADTFARRDAPQDKGALNLVYVGALIDHRFLLEMIGLVAKRPDVHLKISGFGPLSVRIQEAISGLPNISFLGRIPYDEAMALTMEADLNFAIYDPKVPNHKFSNPNKVYEAMMASKPVIVAKGMGIDLLVERENCGYLVEYEDADSVGRLLDHLCEFPAEVVECGMRGRKAYEERYSWGQMKIRLDRIYSQFNRGCSA